ncbi:chorion protein S15 [Drosophila subpulchrella]|uniref:chorion protein S15 n=1 Tax=Drosophila subpulchrella TaxID=1486046 RepID=UPI0018A190F2|nr:chorion protein S15 [Drosophila subpulchrella]
MKYLIVFVTFALFAYINASPVYGNRGGHGGGYGGIPRVVYEEVPLLAPRGYDNYPRSLRSEGNGGRAAAAAAAAAAAVNPGSYRQYAVPSYEIDGGRGIELGRGYGPVGY